MKSKPSCFGLAYNYRVKECQICKHSEACWQAYSSSCKKPVIKNGYTIALVNVISQKKKATVNEIQAELSKRFQGKELNIYYYLSVLKKQGLIDVTIEGRQRFYSLR